MLRSLFARLAATHLAVALVTLTTLGLLLGGLLQSFMFRERERTLIRYGRELAGLAARLPHSPMERYLTFLQLEAMERLVDARIWIVAPDGTVVLDSYGRPPRAETGKALRVNAEDMERIMAGETVVRRGLFSGFRGAMISVGIPIYADERPAGAIFLHAPVFGVQAALARIYHLFWLAALAASAVALGLSLWLSRRLARPLHEMSEAAQELARGRFDRRVAADGADDEIGRLAASFNHMAAQLGNLERLRREFIANVSHELRSPLTSMRGFLQGVLDGTVPPGERERYLRLAFDETRRLSRLVNDLLDLAALEAGEVAFSMADVNVGEVLRRAAAKMEPQAAAKGLTLRVEPGEAGTVRADPDRLEQVVINLLDNAVRFTPQGGTVTLAARQEAAMVEIAVSDTGQGIPPEDLDRIWERFYKGDRARTRAAGGTGLGLAIARELVERLGGTIAVQSRMGEGTTFTVTLPAAHP